MQIFAIVVSLAVSVVAVVMTVRAVRSMLATIRIGQPALNRSDQPLSRTLTMLKETVLHTRMLQWTWVGILHWFAFAAFIVLSTAVAQAFFQLFDAEFAWPLIGHWIVYEWISEIIGLLGALAILPLFVYRVIKRPSTNGRQSRFFGSTMWQAYFVEAMVFLESSAIIFIRAAEYKHVDGAEASHFPISHLISGLYPDSHSSLENIIYFIAMVKIVSAMAWLMVIASNLTMGVAWHRFTAWFNIWFKRESSGGTALGALKPLTSNGKAITLDDIDDLDEDSTLGVGSIEDFSWKGILDFTTCTECGRCQSQCPAWNTEKPLSPKLLMMGLREHAYAKAGAPAADSEGQSEAEQRTLIGKTDHDSDGSGTDVTDWFYNPEGGDFVIDEDVLWSCTSCGACVQQCPVDIEHVDHIVDMRRYQVLVESNFPAELNQLFKGLENKGNPWNMSASARMDWAKDLPFDVKEVGKDIEDLESVDWLFWVGCAGAYEDRAKKTTRAVAELLDMAGVSFGVLGNGETCTGDPARRAGNEFVFQGLAAQNVETFKEFKVKKVVSTCAHCFNTLKNEYKDFGIELEVVHHTQLLNRLVREGKLTPVKEGAGAEKRSITYHDPCFLGRHNQVYSPPRELLQILPGAEVKEMPRNSEKSFCCGAGGARMWMEETIGERINVNRTKEAVATGADQIAVGCPFCRVMLSDGLTSEQANGGAREEVEVLDVAQMLLASVKGEVATRVRKPEAKKSVATKAEPAAGDVTQSESTVTKTEDVGAAAEASGGSSLFDAPADSAPAKSSGGSLFDTPADSAPAEKPAEEPAQKPAASGGSLFDLEADAPAEKPEAKAEAKPASESAPKSESKPAAGGTDLGGGGSLFDIAEEKPAAKAEPKTEAAAKPAAEEAKAPAPAPAQDVDLGSGGSLFDIEASEPAPAAKSEPAAAEDAPAEAEVADADVAQAPAEEAPVKEAPAQTAGATGSASTPKTDVDLNSGGSLFDIEAPAETPAAKAAPAPAPEAEKSDAGTPAAAESPKADAPQSSGASSTPATDVDISSMGSLFDIEAPAATAAPAPAAAAPAAAPEPAAAEAEETTEAKAEVAPEPEAEAAPAAEAETESEAGSEEAGSEEAAAPAPTGAEVSQAASQASPEPDSAPEAESAPESDTEPATPEAQADADTESEPEPEAESEAEPAAEEVPAAPKASGETNTPKQANINEAGSLFDL